MRVLAFLQLEEQFILNLGCLVRLNSGDVIDYCPNKKHEPSTGLNPV
jgi:hypothetical protein